MNHPSKKLTIQECEVDNDRVTITKKEYATGRNGSVSYSYQRVERQVVVQPHEQPVHATIEPQAIQALDTSTTIDNCVDALEQVQERIAQTRRSNQHFVRKAVPQDVVSVSEFKAKEAEFPRESEYCAAPQVEKNQLELTPAQSAPQEVILEPKLVADAESEPQVVQDVFKDVNPDYMDPAEIIKQHLQAQQNQEAVVNSEDKQLDISSTSQFVPETTPNLEKSFSQPDSCEESLEAQIDMTAKKSNNPETTQQAELETTQVEVEVETTPVDAAPEEQATEAETASEATAETTEEIVIDAPATEAEAEQVVEPEPTPFELFAAKLNARDNLRNVITALEELKASVKDGLDLTLPENAEYIQALTTFLKEVVAANTDILTFDNAKKQETISRVKVLIEERRKVVERLTREYDSAKQFANEKPVKDVVKPLFQNFATALDRFPKKDTTEEFDTFKTKLRSFEEQLRTDLAKFGIVIFGQAGDAFDPTRHDAVAQYPAQTPEQANTLAYVSAQGYELNGRVVSPATVITYGDFEG